ncbi:MAG: outer membrane protein transport protein [Pseudomonadales bacterium]|nr:outer membrane protein transport protein [Pseudomonadales bacterium]
MTAVKWLSAVPILFWSLLVFGQGTQNITIGNPKALALGNAVTADPPGIDSIHFNPAGLAKLTGHQRNLKLMVAGISLTSETGDQHHSPEVKTAYEQVNPGATFPIDDQANQKATTSNPMVMLPFAGLTNTPIMIAPIGGASFQDPHQRWTIATMAYTPQAFGFKRDRDNDPGAYQGYEMGLSRITYLSPSIGLQLTDNLAIGASLGLSWHGFGTKTKFRSPEQTLIFIGGSLDQLQDEDQTTSFGGAFDNVGDLTLELEDTLSPSFNFGLLWEPYPWLALGLVYQSEATAKMKGSYRMEYTDSFQATAKQLQPLSPIFSVIGGAEFNAQSVEKGHAEMEMVLPQHIAIGTSIQLLPDLKVNIDIKWTEYSSWENFTITFDQNLDFLNLGSVISHLASDYGVEDNVDPDELRMPRQYQDVLSWAIGIEYQWDNRTTIRVGYEPRGSAVPDDRVDFLVPIADATLYGLGMGYQIDRFSSFDIGVGYLSSEFEADIETTLDSNGNIESIEGESKNANDTTPGQVVYNPYAYLPIKGSTEAFLFSVAYQQAF